MARSPKLWAAEQALVNADCETAVSCRTIRGTNVLLSDPTAAMEDERPPAARIREHYAGLPAAERRLADVLLALDQRASGYSATELAQEAGVSKASASRLIQRLGYGDFGALRRDLRGDRPDGAPLDRAVSADRSLSRLWERESANLTRTIEALRPDMVAEAAGALAEARHVYIAGWRNSHFFAAYLHKLLSQLRPHARLLTEAGQTMGEILAGVEARDMVVLIGLRRRPPQARRLLAFCAQRALPTLTIAERGAFSGTPGVTWRFSVETTALGLFDSYGPTAVLCGYLADRAAARMGAAARERLAQMEHALEALDELDRN